MGVLLVTLGLGFVLFTSFHSVARWVTRLWPIFLILAGLVQLIRFAVERRPRSPFWGGLLVAVGGVLLAGRLHPGLNVLRLYGMYWPLLLLVFATSQVIRHYTHRPDYGAAPRLFSPFRVIVLLLIVGSGVAAARLSASGAGVTLKLPKSVGGLSGSTYTFSDPAVNHVVAPGARIAITNKNGDVEVIGGGQGLRAVLTKRVRAWTEADASETAGLIQLEIERTADGIQVKTSPEQLENDVTATIKIEIPQQVSVAIDSGAGKVSVNRLQGAVSVRGDGSQVNLTGISGDVNVTGETAELEAHRVTGSVVLAGSKRARVSQVSGSVDVSARNGSIDLRDITGDVNIVAPFSSVIAESLRGVTRIKAEHADVKISDSIEVEITAPRSDVNADDI
jgi:hypothetical protein